jgi:hypothetical protein
MCHPSSRLWAQDATIVASGLSDLNGGRLCLEVTHRMKRLLICTGLLIAATTVFAQKPLPVSPPSTEVGSLGDKVVTVTYSSPRVKGRAGHIFGPGGLISHDPNYPVWRAGANAATLFHTDADINIGTLNVPKGTYSLYVDISDPDSWVLIVNKQVGQWGLKYDKTQDLGRVNMNMSRPPALVEDLEYSLKDTGGNTGTLTLTWEHVSGEVDLSLR